VKFGILYNIDYHPSVHGSASSYYEQILEQVELLEELGYDAAWFGEHHYAGYSFGNPAMIALAAASRTKRLRLGTGVSLIPLHHPLRLAEEYAMLDVLSGGRLDYGVGRGFLSYAYDLFGVDLAQSHERYHEGVDLIIKAWTADGPFSFDGRFWKLRDYEFFPKPVQKPHPPIFAAGAGTPASFTWAGKRGLDLRTALFGPDKTLLKNGLNSYRETWASNGYDPAHRTVTSVTQMYCGETKAEALRHGGEYTLNYYKFFAGLDGRGSKPSGARGFGGGQNRGSRRGQPRAAGRPGRPSAADRGRARYIRHRPVAVRGCAGRRRAGGGAAVAAAVRQGRDAEIQGAERHYDA
jgi:alkanesulfonate monooxygenase SsuD/methylene tetrahydromethanopterin reductase-like flavin-dependent oxidoreductase (luciferase family)